MVSVQVSPSIKFDLSSGGFAEDFPKAIPLNEADSLSTFSFQESYTAAQEAGVPYYSVAVVVSGNESEKFYKIYDTSYCSTHIYNKVNAGDAPKDPITGRKIQKVHYFAVQCFNSDPKTICKPIDLSKDVVSLSPFNEEVDATTQSILLDSINSNILSAGSPKSKQNVRRMQYIIADLIEKRKVFAHLSAGERRNEVIKWLWCSAKGSAVGLLNLAKACSNHHGFTKETILGLLSPSIKIFLAEQRAMSQKERVAMIDLIDMQKKLQKEIESAKKLQEALRLAQAKRKNSVLPPKPQTPKRESASPIPSPKRSPSNSSLADFKMESKKPKALYKPATR